MPDPIPFRNTQNAADDTPDQKASSGPAPDDRIYSNEEVSEIIRIALGKAEHLDQDTVNHEELLSIARDFGLGDEDLDRAFQEITRTRSVEEHVQKAALYFKLHAVCYLIVNAGLFGINALSDPSFWWVGFPVVAWGTVLLLHYVATKYVPALPGWIVETLVMRGEHSASSNWTTQQASGPAKFIIDDLYGDMVKVKGIADVEGGVLHLEYQLCDNLFGGFRSKVREANVPLEHIAAAHLERRVFNNKLIIQATRMKAFDSVPGNEGGQLTLRFSGVDRGASERLVRILNAGKNK